MREGGSQFLWDINLALLPLPSLSQSKIQLIVVIPFSIPGKEGTEWWTLQW